MFKTFEVIYTLAAIISFMVLLFMEPPYSRHSFHVESNPDYPDKQAFAPSPLSKASILLTNEYLIDSYTDTTQESPTSANTIIPSICIVYQLGMLSEICKGNCSTLASNLLYEEWQQKDFQLELEEYTDRLKAFSTNDDSAKPFNFLFKSKLHTLNENT
jgi:hypothetical protein